MALIRGAALSVAVAVLLAVAGRAALADPADRADYFPAVREELARLDLDAVCDELTATCTFTRKVAAGQEIAVGVRYDAASCTVYLFIERFLVLEDPAGPSLELSRRLLELNRRLVAGKFEWEPESNTIRLTAILAVDSNFDRKAFRSVVLGLLTAAERLRPELGGLASG